MHLPFQRGPMITTVAILCATLLASSTGQTTSPGSDALPTHKLPSELQLYRGLFSIVAHMERDRLARLANPEGQVGDMAAVEESLRKKMDLPKADWQAFVTTAVKVDAYTEETSNRARAYARQGRTEAAQSVNKAQTISTVRADLHKMQVDMDARVLKDTQELEANVGADSTAKIHAYLHGPLADSAHVTSLKSHGKAAQ